MTYEIYYNDGGHCGVFRDFNTAYNAAIASLNKQTTVIEIRPNDSRAIGGFRYNNKLSFYVERKIETFLLHYSRREE